MNFKVIQEVANIFFFTNICNPVTWFLVGDIAILLFKKSISSDEKGALVFLYRLNIVVASLATILIGGLLALLGGSGGAPMHDWKYFVSGLSAVFIIWMVVLRKAYLYLLSKDSKN